MNNIKTFESWENNIIDKNLFKSGRAKYNPKVSGGKIKYKTGNTIPYYYAEIYSKTNVFICKIFKKDNEKDIKIKNKIKDNLKDAHNYVREFLNQKLKRDKEKPDELIDKEDKLKPIRKPSEDFDLNPIRKTYNDQNYKKIRKSNAIIRRF